MLDLCRLNVRIYTLFDVKGEIQSFLGLEGIEGSDTAITIVQSTVLFKEEVAFFFKVSQQWRNHVHILLMAGIVSVGKGRTIVVGLRISWDLADDELSALFSVD